MSAVTKNIDAEASTNEPSSEMVRSGRGVKRNKATDIVNACTELASVLESVASDFWGSPIAVRFTALHSKNLYFWRTDDFYVSQLPLAGTDDDSEQIVQLRISDSACACLLNQVLGHRPDKAAFRVGDITNFEAQLLTEFSKDVFTAFLKNLVTRKSSPKEKPRLVHLAWSLNASLSDHGDDVTGKLILTLPLENLRLKKSEPAEIPALDDALFLGAHAEGTVWIGHTRITLEDLQNLEYGDIVVLNSSQTSELALIEPTSQERITFNTEISNRNLLEVPFTQEMSMMEQQTLKDQIWDNLMIDVNAEFFPTRLPLNQLKQMSEGLIVEVGDLTRNQVRLHIEGNTVALGELVIVGEKFGVRINEVKDKHDAPVHAQQPSGEMPPAGNTADETHPLEPNETAAPEHAEAPQDGDPAANPAPQDGGENDDDWLNDDFDDDNFGEDEW